MKKSKVIFTAIILASIGILAASAGYYFSYQSKKEPEVAGTKQEVSTLNWKTYSNSKYGFKLIYPNRWQVNESQTLKSVNLVPKDENESSSQEKGIVIEVKENASSLSSYDWLLQNFDGNDYQKRTLKACQYNQNPCSEIANYQERFQRVVVFAKENLVIIFSIIDTESLMNSEKILESFTLTSATANQDKIYVIKQGETLATIAGKFNMSWSKLARYNKISSPDSIYVGQKIKIPADPESLPSTSIGASVDYDLAQVYQERVDAGKEVWRLDPIEVCKKEVPPQKGITENDRFQIVSEDKLNAEVKVQIITKNNSQYLATLIQPARHGVDGIWMVKSLTSQ